MPTVKATTEALNKRVLSDAERKGFDRQLGRRNAKWKERQERSNQRALDAQMENRLFRSVANDIQPLPAIADPERRARCKNDLKLACETYWPMKFQLAWSPDHLDLIKILETCILSGGGLFANAHPRGNGKTTIAESAGLWAILNGHRKYMLLICATTGAARDMFRSIHTEIETNELLAADFPEAIYPIQQLRGSYFRARFQHFAGEPTRITLTSELLMLPTIEGSECSGSVIQCASLTGRLRGMKQTTSTGESLRPDFVIVDDPQTDRSAKSPNMTAQREKIINGTICGLAGPQKPLAVVMPCTVIAKDDLAERFLNREKRPQWQGQRTKLMPQMPENLELWQKYNEIRAISNRAGNGGREATEFYAQNREEMDKGAIVSWAERYNPPQQISAVQFAMDLFFDDPVTFASEYQNDPLIQSEKDGEARLTLLADKILDRFSGMRTWTIPRNTFHVTSGVDVQGKLLYYLTVAWTEDFGGQIVDYGVWPKQPLDYFLAANPPRSFADEQEIHNMALPPQIFHALETLYAGPLSREFTRDELGGFNKPEKCLIDANWSQVTDAVYGFCKKYEATGLFHPSHGKGIGAAALPMDQWPTKAGEKRGQQPWIQRFASTSNRGRHLVYDTNWWKSLVAERLIAPPGAPNALLIAGEFSARHQLLADHLSSEIPIRTIGRGRHVDEWRQKPGTDNHWWDCLIQAAVGASMAGLVPHDMAVQPSGGGGPKTAAVPKVERRVVQMLPAGKR